MSRVYVPCMCHGGTSDEDRSAAPRKRAFDHGPSFSNTIRKLNQCVCFKIQEESEHTRGRLDSTALTQK